MSRFLVKAAGLTDRGKLRSNNEDAVWVDSRRGLLIVADGMGGHQSGEIASNMAISSIPTNFEQLVKNQATGDVMNQSFSVETNRLGLSLKMANQMIFEAGERHPQDHGMGTTCTAALITGGRLSVAHVGDSRCYRIRHGQMEQLTQDHSLVMEQVRRGLLSKDDPAVHSGQNILTRSLGIELDVDIDLDEHSIFARDIILLCSDGLGKELNDEAVLRIATETTEPTELAQRLIDSANNAGGRDNITVAVARIDRPGLGASIKNLFESFRG